MHILGDFHVHSNFCPHGTSDSMESYIQQAIKKGFKYLSFTEHAPLPKSFIDPTPDKDSGLDWDKVEIYIKEATAMKEKYQGMITINVGFEVDFIEGYEAETKKLLDQFGEQLDDAILSVHMLKTPQNKYVCLDYSPEEFKRIVGLFGSVDDVHATYYDTVNKAIMSDLGKYKPSRIGHLTLVNKFSKIMKPTNSYDDRLKALLTQMKKNNLQLDVNTAGLYKEYCGAIYPDKHILQMANEIGLPLIPGSDSHTHKHIGRGFDTLPNHLYSIPV